MLIHCIAEYNDVGVQATMKDFQSYLKDLKALVDCLTPLEGDAVEQELANFEAELAGFKDSSNKSPTASEYLSVCIVTDAILQFFQS